MSHYTKSAKASRSASQAISLVLIMLLSSLAPILASPVVSAHGVKDGAIWPTEGHNDTGWVQLNTVGAGVTPGAQGTTEWQLEFAPGADLSNVSLQLRVNGSDGLLIEEPILTASDIGINLFDWRGLGMFGSSDFFDGSNPHSSRLNPNSDTGAGWTLPSDAEITELVFEALAPADPAVSFEPINLDIRANAIHPDDGRMMVGVTNSVVVLDANNDPRIIDIITFENASSILDIAVDEVNRYLIVLTDTDGIHFLNLDDSSLAMVVSAPAVTDSYQTKLLTLNGNLFMAGYGGLFEYDYSANSWQNLVDSNDTNWNSGFSIDMIEHNGIIYVSSWENGINRWDISSATSLSTWTTANVLHSDYIWSITVTNNQILFGSYDNGVARFDWNSNFWLSTWNSANWLGADDIWGVESIGDQLLILNGANVHYYNTTSGVFGTTDTLSNYGIYAGRSMFTWPSGGSRAPMSDTILLTDYTGKIVKLTPTKSTRYDGQISISSSPSSGDMTNIVELDNVLFITNPYVLDRYDIGQSKWLSPVIHGMTATSIHTDGNSIYMGTEAHGIINYAKNGSIINSYSNTNGMYSNSIANFAINNGIIVSTHQSGGISIINLSSASILSYDSSDGMDSDFLNDVAIHQDIAYIGSEDSGIIRYHITNDTFLSSWVSTGVNGVDYAPIAVVGDILHLGLSGYGVARKNMVTNEILLPLTEFGAIGVLPSDTIYSLEANGNLLYIGTNNGAIEWDGSSSTNFINGGQWSTRPAQFFDFVIDGGDLYVGTNIGVCKYVLSTITIDDCQNVQDGMPNWAVYAVHYDSDFVYGGTLSGVGLIDITNFEHDSNWGEGSQSATAPVEVINTTAYIGLDGIGVLRYDITNNTWLPTWTVNNVLDTNGITSLVADIRPNQIWIGGDDGFQLIDIVNETEEYDIEKTNSLYSGNGDPYQLMIHGDVMYFHQSTQSDSIGRINIANFTSLTSLDIGSQLSENNGDVYGMNFIGDTLMVGLASGQWWNADGSGGIAQWNASNNSWGPNVEPIGEINRVTSYLSSAGNHWVAWGETKLDLYNNGSLVNSWDDSVFDFPIRGIVEFDGATLFATEDGVARYNESSNSWLTTWTEGSGLPNNAGERFYDIWTDGTELVVGGAEFTGWGGFRTGTISHLDSTGTWSTFTGGQSGMPNGYPISMTMCGGFLNVAMYNNFNGGIAVIDLQNATAGTHISGTSLEDDTPSAVACDGVNTLYIAYYADDMPVSKYSYQTGTWLNDITSQNHNIPSDRVWWDAINYHAGKLILGHGLGTSGNNIIGGGYSVITTSGTTAASATVISQGSSVTSFQPYGQGWIIGQAGGTSGYSHVDIVSSQGQTPLIKLPGLVSGQITSIAGSATTIWVTTFGQSQGFGVAGGAGILQGNRNADGSIEWDYGWSLSAQSRGNDVELIGNDLYVTTYPAGLYKLDIQSQQLISYTGALHNNHYGMVKSGNDLIIGLSGQGSSIPGVQVFNINSQTFTQGKLIAGLPSNVINGFGHTSDVMYIATNGGIGRWNYTTSDWMNPITILEGLPSNIVEDILVDGNDIWLTTPSGVAKYNEITGTITTMTSQNGLFGTSTWGLTMKTSGANSTLFISHDGKSTERPGVSSFEVSTPTLIDTHRFDQIPSNTVSALAADWWGLHIATDIGPMTHWNGQVGEFEDGMASWQISGWPITSMQSDGDDVLVITEQGAAMIKARTATHAITKSWFKVNASDGVLTANNVWLTTESDGLWGYERTASWTELDRFEMRRAMPLNAGFNMKNSNISEWTHPGAQIQLVDVDNPVKLDSTAGAVGAHGLLFQNVPLTFTSTVDGAATWSRSVSLKYNATVNLTSDPGLENTIQNAVDNGVMINGTRYVTLTLRSPSNGSLQARLVYDYIKLETPVEMTNLIDRPDDGGGAVMADWTLVHDEDFARYLIYVNEGPFATTSGSALTEADLSGRTVDKAISLHSRLSSEVTTANGMPLVDGTEYYAVIVVEYNDGRWGLISLPMGPATPTDEVPKSPLWASAGPYDGGQDGDLEVEWARCTALDLASTRIYTTTSEMTDILGLSVTADLPPSEGNTTVLSLDAGKPYWLGLTCVDEAGQEDWQNATIIGPVVPTGGLNDNTAPAKLENVSAIDTPDDDGGRITISWDISADEDCTFYAIFMMMVEDDEIDEEVLLPNNVNSFTQTAIINDCAENSTVVSSMDGVDLQDGQLYWVGVVAYDDWLNANLDDVDVVGVTPFRNTVGSGSAPSRIGIINAFDHAEDDGTAIDVVWSISDADDFSHYIVWVADKPVTDLSTLWAARGDDSTTCACLKVNKQWIDEDKNPIEITMSTALYGGDSLLETVPKSIMPDVELYVTVTVHDIKGNVFLTDLVQATVTPIDNLNDDIAPDRLQDLRLFDRPADDGTALLLDFNLSDDGDVKSYAIYAATWQFTSVSTGGDGPIAPIATLSRTPQLPLSIKLTAGDTPVVPGQTVWVAVVVIDSSGNSFEDELVVVSAASIDDGVTDMGSHLPEIIGISLAWNEEVNILVQWQHSSSSSVRGYQIYISSEEYSNTDDAILVGEVKATNTFLITQNGFEDLVNNTAWYVSVSAIDEEYHKESVNSIKLEAFDSGDIGDGNSETEPEDESKQLGSYLTTPNLLAIGLAIVALFLLLAIFKSRGSNQRRSKDWELQEATWGLQNQGDAGWDNTPKETPAPPPAATVSQTQSSDIYANANRVQADSYGRPAYQSQQPVLQPVRNDTLLDDLIEKPAQQPQQNIDTSFLDDLL